MHSSQSNNIVLFRILFATEDIKMDLPFKPNADTNVAKKGLDLQNKTINLMNQGAPATSVGTRQDLQLSNLCVIYKYLSTGMLSTAHTG